MVVVGKKTDATIKSSIVMRLMRPGNCSSPGKPSRTSDSVGTESEDCLQGTCMPLSLSSSRNERTSSSSLEKRSARVSNGARIDGGAGCVRNQAALKLTLGELAQVRQQDIMISM